MGQLTDDQVAEVRALVELLKVESGVLDSSLTEDAFRLLEIGIDVGVNLTIAAVNNVFKGEAQKELPDDNSD